MCIHSILDKGLHKIPPISGNKPAPNEVVESGKKPLNLRFFWKSRRLWERSLPSEKAPKSFGIALVSGFDRLLKRA